MSEKTYSHYRSGTFPLTVEGFTPPLTVEARWVRDHHVVHLFLPEISGTATEAVTLEGLPHLIRPSRAEVFPVQMRAGQAASIGLLSWEAGAQAVQAHATVERGAFAGEVSIGPCVVHYLSIPGQVQDAAGVLRFVAEGETPDGTEDQSGQTGESPEGDARVQGAEPTFL